MESPSRMELTTGACETELVCIPCFLFFFVVVGCVDFTIYLFFHIAPRAAFKIPGYRPSELDKKFLVWSGRFKTVDQIPELVS